MLIVVYSLLIQYLCVFELSEGKKAVDGLIKFENSGYPDTGGMIRYLV